MSESSVPQLRTVNVVCTCNHQFTIQSTHPKDQLAIDVCCMCHPFYTNEQKIVNTADRIVRFNKRYGGMLSEES